MNLSGERQLRYKANAEAARALADLREGDEAEFRRRIAAFTAGRQRDAVDPELRGRLRDAILAQGGLFDANVRGRWQPDEDGPPE